MVIYKYLLDGAKRITLAMPRNAQILYIDTQAGQPCLWALVDPEQPRLDRYIGIYPFGVADRITLALPHQARILRIDTQENGQPRLWAEVNPEHPEVFRHFRIFGTGHPIPGHVQAVATYVASWQQPPFVWHLFEDQIPR